jgi:Transcriptional regulator PadR-like family
MGKREPLEIMPGTLDLLILQALARSSMHGYGIAQTLKAASEDVLEIGESSLYPLGGSYPRLPGLSSYPLKCGNGISPKEFFLD